MLYQAMLKYYVCTKIIDLTFMAVTIIITTPFKKNRINFGTSASTYRDCVADT